MVAGDPAPKGDASLLWTRWMLRLPSMNARQILEECIRVAAEQFANTSDADLPMAIEKEIARDIHRLQMQPVIMDKYRRFVVVKGRGQVDTCFREDKYGVSVAYLSDMFWLMNDLEPFCTDRGDDHFGAGLQRRLFWDLDRLVEEVDLPLRY